MAAAARFSGVGAHGCKQIDTELALKLLAARATTKPMETVAGVLYAIRRGESINAAAEAVTIHYRTAQRIAVAAAEHEQRVLAVVSRLRRISRFGSIFP